MSDMRAKPSNFRWEMYACSNTLTCHQRGEKRQQLRISYSIPKWNLNSVKIFHVFRQLYGSYSERCSRNCQRCHLKCYCSKDSTLHTKERYPGIWHFGFIVHSQNCRSLHDLNQWLLQKFYVVFLLECYLCNIGTILALLGYPYVQFHFTW